ncbi:FAD-dependent urate hydroxylase [Entomophthora muscae]|uniref:FAD-dependent urate hydroxylase n=1 Tax=Entomophthora muscae TaxID=34485 RepID=A0ACC2TY04_9FUNG|nr:FAD-dependent urate hydroxylase [Entomophthora muscae]
MLLLSMILSGPFLQLESPLVAWLQDVSFFHSALEAIISNEMSTLEIHDKKYGMVIEVPVAPILQIIGFTASEISRNLFKLSVSLLTFMSLAYAALHFLVKERR